MRIMRALTACAALAAILGPVRAESAPRGLEHIQWDDADVRIWDWKRAPVFLAGWTGPVLPYTLRSDRVVPILGEEALVPMKGMDVVDVLPLSDNEILFEARFRPGPGGPSRGAGLYYHRTGSAEPKPVAGTEAIGLHTGCVYPKSRQVAFARGGTEVIARLGPAGQLVGLQEAGSPLSQCLWLGHDELIGIATSGGRLTRCRSTAGQIACAGTSALEGLDSASKLFLTRQGKAGVLGRRSNEPNSGIFLFSKDFESVSGPMADRDSPGGASILDYDGEIRRYGFHAKYFINLARDAAGVVYSAARIGSKVFGIVSTPARPKSLARLERGAWKLFQSEKEAAKPDGPPLREVWIQLRSGYLVQAFHFGRPDSDKAVIWWHGGNQVGNSSPRYSPYFHFLAENGYSTLAVNYPGDLGRGPGHSGKFTEPFLTDTADASVRYLREAGATRIVSWSLSGGLRLQQSVLGAQEKVSGIIDQVGRLVDRDEKGKRVGRGYGTRRHRELAAQRGIPYFTIRGRFDNPD
ncbi:MAG TPA: hypothetical protein VM598_10475, partial [Bdellovibrionota bacterium]|nr:hypothetical protein [Bdellovibrionota bacterium]